jgi:hypothetical protein
MRWRGPVSSARWFVEARTYSLLVAVALAIASPNLLRTPRGTTNVRTAPRGEDMDFRRSIFAPSDRPDVHDIGVV